MKQKGLVLLLTFAFFLQSPAQQFGAFPPSTKWYQINTDTLRVIFEGPVDSQAQKISAIIHKSFSYNPTSLGNGVRKINTVIHKNSTLANGYVALGPFRSEYYLIPQSDLFEFGSTPWPQTLAVHEYRHAHQYSNFNKGVSKVASYLLGQEGQALFNSISIPDWFFEGDAVHAETIQTAQGRGRAPAFFNGFKSLWVDGRTYNWMKLRNGSLKDFVPNHYPLGYLLVNYGYKTYGNDFWKKVTEESLGLVGTLRLFGGNIKKFSGLTFKSFREQALESYKHEVSVRRDGKQSRQTVTDYLFPQQITADSLMYVKRSYRQLPAFYLNTRGKEQRLKLRNITTEDWFSYRNGIIAYTGFSTHPRWELVNYSNLILLDITSGKEKIISQKSRYFTPDISPDGATILAVSYTDSLESELHLLDTDGKILQRFQPPGRGDLFVHPRFIDNRSFVVAIRANNSDMSFVKNTVTGSGWQVVVPPGPSMLGYPFVSGDKLYFTSSQSGNDDLFQVDLNSTKGVQTILQLHSSQTGNYFPSVYGDSITWSRFTSNGLRIRQQSLALEKTKIDQKDFLQRNLPFPVALDSAAYNVLNNASGAFPVTPYRKASGLFNFHSWRPNFTDPEISFSVYSDNYLNTFTNELYYLYNINETSHGVGFNSFYGGWFPVLNAGLSYTFDRSIKTPSLNYKLNELEARFGYSIPLNFTRNNLYSFLNFGSNFVFNQLKPTEAFRNILRQRDITYLHHTVRWSQQLPTARQHIFPKFAYAINLQQRHLVQGKGYQFLGGTTLFLPSIANHSIALAANWQETDTANITFSNRFANSRGYNDFYFSRMWRLSGNYHMPLLYPDAGIPGLVYVLRIRSNVFYDFTKVYSRNKLKTADQRSVGGEIFFDSKFFNSLPISLGFRLSHLLDDDFSGRRPKGSNYFEIIVPLDLIPR